MSKIFTYLSLVFGALLLVYFNSYAAAIPSHTDVDKRVVVGQQLQDQGFEEYGEGGFGEEWGW